MEIDFATLAFRVKLIASCYGFDHVEKRDDRVLLFATWLSAGEHIYKYQARVTTPGTFMLPSTHAEAMYTPEVFGRFEGSVVEVK